MKEVRVAIIGAGYMAQEHTRAFASLDDAQLSGIYSRSSEPANALASSYPGVTVCRSIEELWQQTQAHLVVVTVSVLSMREVAEACFSYPWTVLLEKPAGYNLKDASAILEAAQRTDARAYVALNRRAYSSTRTALNRLAQLGSDMRFIRVQDQQDQAELTSMNKFPAEVIRNIMFANSIHLIDCIRVFGRGEITSVTRIAPWTPESPSIVLAKVDFSSGDIGFYEGVWNGPGPWAISVNTARERLEMRPLEQLTVQLHGERRPIQQAADPVDQEFKPGLKYQALQAVNAARGASSSLPTLGDAWHSMKLVADIFGMWR